MKRSHARLSLTKSGCVLPDFRTSLRYSEVESLSLSEFSHILRDVDIPYREKKAERREKEPNQDRNHERECERTRDHDRLPDHRNIQKKDHKIKSHKKLNRRNGSKDEKKTKDKKGSSRDASIPEIRPENQWKFNANGRMMKRRCHY